MVLQLDNDFGEEAGTNGRRVRAAVEDEVLEVRAPQGSYMTQTPVE